MADPSWDSLSPATAPPSWDDLSTARNPAPAGGVAPDDPRESGGFLSRVGNFLHRTGRMADVGGHQLVAGVERLGQTGANALGLGTVGDYLGGEAAMNEKAAETPVSGATDWQTVKAHPTVGNIGSYIADQGAAALPSLGAAAVSLPLFAASRLGDVAHTRAVNSGKQAAGIGDVVEAAPSAAVDSILMRGGLSSILEGSVGKAAAREALAQGGMPVADYAGETVGTNKPFEPAEAADRALSGIVAGLPLGAVGATAARLRSTYAAKGVDTSNIPDGELVEGTLNSSIHPEVGPNDVAEILSSQGVPPESVSPARAPEFAARINAARNRPNINGLGADELARQNGIREDIAAGDTHPSWDQLTPARTPGEDVTIAAAPEGLIRSDDAGGQAGVDRHRAASENVLETAKQHADRDPVIREILDSSLSPDTKVGVLLDRLNKYVSSLPTSEPPPLPDQAPTPFQEPTADQARAHRIEPASQLERELAVTENTESHGDPNAVSPKGARGSMQTMPGTLRDPGFGVRPAENDSPEELRRVGRDYYTALREHYGDPAKAWAAYNDGPGALDGAIRKYGADWLNHMPEETRNYVAKNMAAIGDVPRDTVYRGPAPSEDPFASESGFERTNRPEEPLERTGEGESRMATGDSSRPFMEETDTPAGEDPGFWERRAQMQADELRKEWEASKQEPPPAGADPSQRYGANNYGQRPHMPDGSDTFAMTPEGHIADVNGKPVAFRNIKDAARFAVKNKLAGDFEPQVWSTNSTRVVLTRRPGSTYGERPTRPEGPQEPPAGRSADTSQRAIPDLNRPETEPGRPKNEPPVGETAPLRVYHGGKASGDLRGPVFTSENPDFAKTYAADRGGEVRAFDLHAKRIAEQSDLEDAARAVGTPDYHLRQLTGGMLLDENFNETAPKIVDELRRRGFDAARFDDYPVDSDKAEPAIAVLDPAALRPLRAERGSVSDQSVSRETDNIPAGPERFDEAPPAAETDFFPGGTFERPRPEPVTGAEPPKPRNFARAVIEMLDHETRRSGINHRIDAEDAISHGVPADEIYHDPRAKFPTIKVQYQRLFATKKGPLRSRAKPVKLHSLDWLGDRVNPDDFGAPRGDGVQEHRLAPEHAGELLADSIHGHESAFDRSDPRYDEYNEWVARHDEVMEFEARYGDRWASMPDEELDRIDAEEGHDAQLFDMLNHVLGSEHGSDEGNPAPEAQPAAEDQASGGGSEAATAEAGGREPAAEDALIPERPTDQRDALQRRADERLRPNAEQKPAGSDGGLFDTQDTTGDLYGSTNKFVTREDYEKAGEKFRESTKRAHSGIDPDAVSATATQAAFHVEASARKLASMLLEPDADPGEIIRGARDLAKSPVKTTKGLLRNLDRFGSAVAYSSDGALRTLARHYNSPTIVKLADMFQARAGAADSTGETYDGALKRNNGRFRSRLDEALDPFIGSKPAMERIRDMLADPGRVVRATEKERAAAREIRDLLKDVIAYRKEAGEDIGEVKNYFPRVVDSLAVANEPAKFKAAAERLYRELGVEDASAAADAWMTRILDTHAGLDGGEEFLQNSGKPASAKSREFGPAADRLLRDFMQKDPLLVLSDYVTGSVRRAEQTRRFGPKGAVNSRERADWMKEHGTKTQWDVMLDKMREEVRASGEDADGVIRQIKAIRDGSMGRLGTVGVRTSRAVSTIHAWNQLSTLQRVTLSSLGDLSMGFIAGKGGMGQGVRHFTTSIKEAARLVESLGKRDLSDAHRWAEALGIVGHTTASQLIQSRMDAAPGVVQHAALLNKFYHKVGIEQLTQGGRVAAAENAKTFLSTLSDDLLSRSARTRQRATFYLKELGIKDPQSFGEWVRNNGVPDRRAIQNAQQGSREAEYAAAVVRFADQTVLMPSRAMKPAWANHPLGSLIFALQSYNAAFTQQVLKRVGRLGIEAAKTKDPHLLAPALGLTMMVGMNALQDYLRTSLFGGANPNETTDQYVLRILDRAGLTGMASPFFNALYGLKYHRSVSQSLQGSVLGRAGQAVDATGGLFLGNSDKTNTAERKAAGLLYDLVIDPTLNAFGAKYVRGAAGTAVIMGTGNKKGGAFPGDRDAFIDAVAGPQAPKG